ncbi:rhodanese-like domain-containing protein [Chloroflexota bacterium]
MQNKSALANLRVAVAIALLITGIFIVNGCSPEVSSNTVTNDNSGETNNSFLPEIPRISVQEVKQKIDAGSNILIIASMARVSYEKSHIPNAMSLPLLEMNEPYDELNGYDEIITYCT